MDQQTTSTDQPSPDTEDPDLLQFANENAGNWVKFGDFAWYDSDERENAETEWALFYTSHRDSGLLAQSNADQVAQELQPFSEQEDPDVVFESHNHFAVGYVDGFSLRIFRDGKITPACRAYFKLVQSLQDYPVLDEEDYSRREYEATCENIQEVGHYVGRDFELPDGWVSAVFTWLWDNDQRELENNDDRGGYPSEASLKRAFRALGYVNTEDEEPDDAEEES